MVSCAHVQKDEPAVNTATESPPQMISPPPPSQLPSQDISRDSSNKVENKDALSAKPIKPTDETHFLIVMKKANLRSAPDTKAKKIDLIDRGQKVFVVEKRDSWYRVTYRYAYKDYEGWVNVCYFEDDKDSCRLSRSKKTAPKKSQEGHENTRPASEQERVVISPM